MQKIYNTITQISIGILSLLIMIGIVQAQVSGGISYQPIFSHYKVAGSTGAAINVNNIGQVSHTVNWNFRTPDTGVLGACNTLINTIASNGLYQSDNVLFYIEGSYDGISYQRMNSINFLLRMNVYQTPNITTDPAITGSMAINGSFPYVRIGFRNNTTPTNDIFGKCELNVFYTGSQNYTANVDTGAVNDGIDYMAKYNIQLNGNSTSGFVGTVPWGSSGKWYDRTYFTIYGLSVCNETAGQSFRIESPTYTSTTVGPFILTNMPAGCTVWPYTGKAYFSIAAQGGLQASQTAAGQTSTNIIFRLEQR